MIIGTKLFYPFVVCATIINEFPMQLNFTNVTLCFFLFRYRSQRTHPDHQTDTAKTNQTDWLLVDTQLSARRRSTGIYYEPEMARSDEQDDRSNAVSILFIIIMAKLIEFSWINISVRVYRSLHLNSNRIII